MKQFTVTEILIGFKASLFDDFRAFMRSEYPTYYDSISDSIDAHDQSDSQWFVSEFIKSDFNKHKNKQP